MRRSLVALVCVAVCWPTASRAQMGRRLPGARAEPDWWVGLSYGYLQAGDVDDGRTNTVWRFGYTSQLAATIDKRVAAGTTVGALMSFATANVDFEPNGAGGAGGACAFGCAGKGDVTQLLLNVQYGGGGFLGQGFHTIEGLDVGVTQYGNFRDANGNRLPPASGSWDPTFGLRFGFGYEMSYMSDLYIAEEAATVLHSAPAGAVNTGAPRTYTTRIGVRIGF